MYLSGGITAQVRSKSNLAASAYRNWSAHRSRRRHWGRRKIQFCHAVSRPKIFVCGGLGPAKRKLASIPVSASGEREVRPSIASRISSSQSRLSGAAVIRPASSAPSVSKRLTFYTRSVFCAVRRESGIASASARCSSGSGARIEVAAAISHGRSGSSSIYVRSAASASSSRLPAKQLPGSMIAKKLLAVRSSRRQCARDAAMFRG